MKKFFTGAALSLIAFGAAAQETYESAELATEDLNGTARYVAMGGAMEALGGDISTMSTNPAGTAMFRRTWAGISGGLTVQKGNKIGNGLKNGVTNADFNQAGFIFVNKVGANSWFNLGFNYHKGRNLNQIVAATGALDGSSANSISYTSLLMPSSSDPQYTLNSALDNLDYYAVLEPSMNSFNQIVARAANAFASHTKTSGYISNFDFNFSGNINDRVYLGLTFGIKDVRYDQRTAYDEDFTQEGTYAMADERTIRGTGFDAKFGVIVRPIEDDPFRFGVYVNTPTWYELKQQVHTEVNTQGIFNSATQETSNYTSPPYDTYGRPIYYKITTPWKFGLSAGSTFGNNIAIGLTYQFSDYSSINNRVNTGEFIYRDTYYNGWGNYTTYETSSKTYADDQQMNRNTKNNLKGVHLLKVGMEVKPIRTVAIRVGYNYESAIYEKYASKDYSIAYLMRNDNNSVTNISGSYNTLRSFTNWQATHRVTFGVGLQLYKNLSLDLSYQYATQKGDFYPFQKAISNDGTVKNTPTVCEVKNNRHLLNATLGVRF